MPLLALHRRFVLGNDKMATAPDLSLRGAKRRGALSAKREEVPLGCNLGKAFAARTSHRRTNTPPSLTVAAVSDRLVEEH